jgi:predicted anti-sigma-YlaC factor YlaD
LRDYRYVECEVAREALSARLDGEREPVPSARVDEHLDGCAACRAWFDQVTSQADGLHRLIQSRPAIVPPGPVAIERVPPLRRSGHTWMSWQRWALFGVGLIQIALATVQGLGLSVGLAADHGMHSGHHLLNESTAWSIALGVIMVGAAVRPVAAAGLAGVLTVFVGVLTVYVIADAVSGAVTTARMLSHLPVVIGAVLAVLVRRSSSRPAPDAVAAEAEIVLPENASRGRRRGHLWPTDGSAA